MMILLMALLARPEIVIPKLEHPPRLEEFENGERKDMLKVEGFTQRERNDGQPSTRSTKVYLGYDDRNLYVIFLCGERGTIRAQMLNRGNPALYSDDFVTVQLDTFHDQRHAYQFASNALGVQQDAIWFENSGTFDYSFDTVFETEGKFTREGYSVYFEIPFRSLRFSSEGDRTWGILLTRFIPGADEQTYWPEYSIKIAGRLNQMATLRGLHNISPGRNIQILPYSAFRSFKAIDDRNPASPRFISDSGSLDLGLDSKYIIHDSVVVDLTANPDFSQVESDDPQITVNQRFEVLFPEKRPFFLENASYFETPIQLLFTRRIADPQFGARVSGKIGDYNFGALLSDDQSPGRSLPEQDPDTGKRAIFSAFRASRDIGNQSSLGVIYTDREFEGASNRTGGFDGRIKLNDNWATAFQAVASSTVFQDEMREKGPAYSLNLKHNGHHFNYNINYLDLSPGFHALAGFVNRTGIRRLDQQTGYTFRTESKSLFDWTLHWDLSYVYDHGGTRLDWWHNPWISFDMSGQTSIGFGYTFLNTRVRPSDFPVLLEDQVIPRHEWGMSLSTEAIPRTSLSSSFFFGRTVNFVPPANGRPASANFVNGNLTLSFRPTKAWTIDNTYIINRLSDPLSASSVFTNHIIRSKWNYQINREWSVRAIIEYNAVLANRSFTSVETTKNLNLDFLIIYLLHPGTALYVGFNSNLQNLDPGLRATPSGLLRTPDDFINDGRQLFVKYSHLFRF